MAFSRKGYQPARYLLIRLLQISWITVGLLGCSLAPARPAFQAAPEASEVEASPVREPANLPATATITTQVQSTAVSITRAAPAAGSTSPPPAASPSAAQPIPTTNRLPDQAEPLLIRSPGHGARVVSPLSVSVDFLPGDPAHYLRIDLFNEGRQLIFRQLLTLDAPALKTGHFEKKVDFELRGEAEEGLMIARLEDRAGRPLAVDSNILILATNGKPVEGGIPEEPFIEIQEPLPGAKIAPGELTVKGYTSADPAKALRVQLIGQDGRLLAQRLARIRADSPLPDGRFAFETVLQVGASLAGDARLLVFLNDGPGGEITHLTSIPLQIIQKP